jgi:chemotaxis protein CheX
MEQYASLFSELCIMVFHDLGKIPISAGKPYTLDASIVEAWDITAVIGLAGSAKGVVALSMKKAVALQLTDKLMGGTHAEIDRQVVDVLGEIANIIAGRAKSIMEDEFRFETALPVVAQGAVASLPAISLLQNGEEHSVSRSGSPVRNICIPFTIFENERFVLSVSVQSAG